ncbi:hypothetical protein Tco_1414502 [Tanacetum coccineum]
MVESQLGWEGAPEERLENAGIDPQKRPPEPAMLAQTTPSPTFIKENIDVLRTMIKEDDQQAKAKAIPRKLVYDGSEEENSDSSGTNGQSERLLNESSDTSRTVVPK